MTEMQNAEISAESKSMPALRGFARLSPEDRRRISSMGGKTAHAKGRARQFTAEEAKVAGQKGGASISQDRAHMQEIGRLGGLKSWQNRRASSETSEK